MTSRRRQNVAAAAAAAATLSITVAVAAAFGTVATLGACGASHPSTSPRPAVSSPSASPLAPTHTSTGGVRPGNGPHAADIALSLTSARGMWLQVTTVDAHGRSLPAVLRLSVGTARTPGSGVTLTESALAVHRVTLPRLAPGGVYFYDLTVTAHGASRTYPAQGRYRFVSPASPTQPLSFLCWGDSRPESTAPGARQPAAFARLVASARARSPQPTLALADGDLINGPGDSSASDLDRKYALFAAIENRLAIFMPVMAAPGNHENPGDAARSSAWRRWFTFPTSASPSGLYYSFDDGDVHFVVLDSASSYGVIGYYGPTDSRNSHQARWLVADLRKNTARWTVVMLHHPLFDPKPTDLWASYARRERDALARLFASAGVDLVFEGHIHNYRRHEEPVSRAGAAYHLAYVTEGGGGADLYSETLAPLDRYDVRAYVTYGYLMLRSDGTGGLTGVAYKVDPVTGATTVGDRFTLDQVPKGAIDRGPAR
jgi:hypothetical protein